MVFMEQNEPCGGLHENRALRGMSEGLELMGGRWTARRLEEAPAAMAVLVQHLDACRERLAADGRRCNTRALLLLQAFPGELVDRVLLRIGVGGCATGAVCAAAAHQALHSVRRSLAEAHPHARIVADGLRTMETDTVMMQCVEAHGLAQAICGVLERHGAVLSHRMCGCGGCGFRLVLD